MSFPQTIRGRLTLWYLISTLGLFIILGTIIGVGLWRILHEQIDHHLHTVIMESKQITQRCTPHDRDQLLQEFANQPGMTIVLMSAEKDVVLQTNSADVEKMNQPELETLYHLPRDAGGTPKHFTVGTQRLALMPVTIESEVGLLVVGYSLKIVNGTFKTLLLIVGFVLITTLLATGYGGTKLLKRFLSPLEEIAVTSAGISHSSNLSKRISTQPQTRELQVVVDSLNAMIARLQQFFQKEQTFFSDAAHTLKTPLAVVRSAIENQDMSVTGKQSMLDQIDKVTDTIQDLLLISRLETETHLEVTPLSLTKLLEELSEIAIVLASEKSIQVRSTLDKEITIKANRQLLSKAFSNLIHNAVQYTQSGGSITLRMHADHHSQVAQVRISDTGSGIPKSDLLHIFDRFYRGKNSSSIKGSGLGLAIAKAAIERFSGTIQVNSQLRHGTTFTVKLPIVAESG